MIRILLIIAQIVPWYLFPGAVPPDTTKAQTPPEEEYHADIPETVNVSLAMPLGRAVPGNMDFYCGALLAARDLGNEGISLTLSAYDSSTQVISAGLIEGSDVFLGPVSYDDVREAALQCPEGRVIISPLDQRVGSLPDSLRIIQTPTPSSQQLRELARWAAEDLTGETSLIVILEPGGELPSVLTEELDSLGVFWTKTVGYSDLDSLCAEGRSIRFLVSSDKEWFNSGAIRSVSVLAMEQHDVSIYCPSRVRSYENLNVELLHNACAHIAVTYSIDYDSPSVRDFVYSYRALFKAEPNSFAFHGYDTMRYFTELCSTYGREWYKKAAQTPGKGLQSDFSFRQNGAGLVNHACRRVVYNRDFTVSVH